MSTTMAAPHGDWTRGGEGIAYQRCGACAARWYFRRGFCPHCGAEGPEDLQSSGQGTVHAATVVARAPSEALRPYAPYCILLVDMAEGFRIMAHGDPGLSVGDEITAGFRQLGEHRIPYFGGHAA
jgi:uncharacterized OB-fold protein